jgi:3-phenylpropionate/trans-cinnamate dioxygenase ferredoxin subunit
MELSGGEEETCWREVARLEDVPLGGILPVTFADAQVLRCRTGAGVFALADRCSRAGWPLREGWIRGESLVCPVHGARFALADGAPLAGPVQGKVTTYRLRIEQEVVQLAGEPAA